MARQLRKTLIDYLVIGISPALIMTLIGSLVFFLIQVFYQGNYQGRLEYIFALFVFAAVLIGRISIEEGNERAILFAIPLALATLFVANRFVQFQGGLKEYSFIINSIFILIVLWSAYKLTWDCTLIDDNEEDSGEGLLESVGIERAGKVALQQEIAPVQQEIEATTSRDEKPPSWWQRFIDRRRKPHAPGVWVIYFSLAALPLFGIGQLFIPPNNLESRQYVFQLLFFYTASGLGLLLSTSFLGVRRYLRQRRQEMPFLMVNIWLITGAVLIIGVMLAAIMLPRPNAEYTIADLPFIVGSPDQTPSPYGQGSDGIKSNQPGTKTEPEKDDKTESSQSIKQTDKSSSEKTTQGENGSKEGQNKNGSQSGSQNKKGDKSQEQGEDQADRDKPKDANKSPTSQRPEKDSNNKTSSGSKEHSESSKDSQQNDTQGRNNNTQTPSPSQSISLPQLSKWPNVITWIFYGVLILVTIYAIWMNRNELLAILLNFREWLFGLFAGRGQTGDADEEESKQKKTPLRRFTDYPNPFTTGMADQYKPEELVRYSFEALEAWANDHGYPRHTDQTPHEFARSLAANVPTLTDFPLQLADLYCQVAYAPGTLPKSTNVKSLSHLWQALCAAPVWVNVENTT